MLEQVGPQKLLQQLKDEAPQYAKLLPALPRLLHDYLQHKPHDLRRELDSLLIREQRRTNRLLQAFSTVAWAFAGPDRHAGAGARAPLVSEFEPPPAGSRRPRRGKQGLPPIYNDGFCRLPVGNVPWRPSPGTHLPERDRRQSLPPSHRFTSCPSMPTSASPAAMPRTCCKKCPMTR
jgi:hypothetical protein